MKGDRKNLHDRLSLIIRQMEGNPNTLRQDTVVVLRLTYNEIWAALGALRMADPQINKQMERIV